MKPTILFSLLILSISSIKAMESDSAERTSLPQKIVYKEPNQISWEILEPFIQKGTNLLAQSHQDGLDSASRSGLSSILVNFRTQFTTCFQNPIQRSPQKIKEVRELLSDFFRYLLFAYHANDGYIRSVSETTANLGAALRVKAVESYPQREPYFKEFQAITNIIFKAIADLSIHKFTESRGIVPASDQGNIAFCMDKNGYVPMPVVNSNYTQIVNINWGEFDQPEHQGNYVIRDGKIINDSGFVLEVLPGNVLKARGYFGNEGAYPFTAHRITARVPIDSTSPFIKIFRSVLPRDITQPRKINEAVFVPIPSDPTDWRMLEVLYLEDLQNASNDEIPKTQVASLLEGVSLDEKLATLTESAMTEYEEKIKKEQEERSKLLSEGKLFPKKAKSKGKGKKARGHHPKQSSQEQQGDLKQRASLLNDVHKADCRIRYRNLLRILHNVTKEFPEKVRVAISVSGSHINIHGDNTGFTIVKPHGGKDDLPPYTVNRIIKRLLTFGEHG